MCGARRGSAWAISLAALLLSPALSEHARAFGGLWSSQGVPIEQSGERIIFVDNADSTVTAIVQLESTGASRRFAWVIPVPGAPRVGISSYTAFQRLDAATAPRFWVEVTVEGTCAPADEPEAALDAGAVTGGPSGAPPGQVALMDRGSVGPYDYVTIAVDPTLDDPTRAARDWLATSGYDATGLDSEVLGPYLSDGLNLLAFKLTKDTQETAIRPVMLTYDGKLPMIPIRPTAVAAQDDMGILVWVIGPSQAVPVNYQSLVLNDALIDWLDGQKYYAGALPAGGVGPFGPYIGKPSNYDAVVGAAANEAGGRGFVTELGAPASAYRDKVWSGVDDKQWALISSRSYQDGIEAVVTANSYYGGWDGFRDSVRGATTLPADVTLDQFIRNPDTYRGVAKVDATEFFRLLEQNVIKPVSDTAALLNNAPYLTRLYSTMSAREMTVDPVFDYNPDLGQIGNVHIAKQHIECSPELMQADAPWQIALPQGGVMGEGSGAWPLAEGSMPANLMIVMPSTSGSGTVVTDNSAEISSELVKPVDAPVADASTEQPVPQRATGSGSMRSSVSFARGDKCGVSRVSAGKSTALALWLLLAGALVARRWGRAGRQS
jgi:hypothetical protein